MWKMLKTESATKGLLMHHILPQMNTQSADLIQTHFETLPATAAPLLTIPPNVPHMLPLIALA